MQGIIFTLQREAEQSAHCHYVLAGTSAPEKSLSPVVKLASCPSRANEKRPSSCTDHDVRHVKLWEKKQQPEGLETIYCGLKQTRFAIYSNFPTSLDGLIYAMARMPPRKPSLCSGECYPKSPASPRGSVRGNRSGLKAESCHTQREPVSKRGGRVAANGTSKEKSELRTGLEVGGSKLPWAALFVQASQVIDSVKHTKSQRHGQQTLAWRTYMGSGWFAHFRH